jgi:hypothetical protein
VLPGGAYLIPISLRTDPATRDPSMYAVRNDGSASPAAVGTLGIQDALPPEMRNKGGHGGGGHGKSGGRLLACGQCSKPFKWTLKGARASQKSRSL